MAFTEDVFSSTQEQDSSEYEKQVNRMRKAAQAAQKRYGTVGAVGPSSESFGDTLAARSKYESGEYDRRKQAAEGKLDLSKTIDTRQGSIADRVREVLFNKQQLQSDTSEAVRQQNEKQAQTLAEQNQDFQSKVAEQEFGRIRNAAARMDAMQEAYDKGMLELQMMDLARSGTLQISDIQRYFDLLKNDIQNQIADLDVNNKAEVEAFKRQVEAKSAAMSSIIGGLTKIGQAAAMAG